MQSKSSNLDYSAYKTDSQGYQDAKEFISAVSPNPNERILIDQSIDLETSAQLLFDTSVTISNPGNLSHVEKRLKPIQEDDEDYHEEIVRRKNTAQFPSIKYNRRSRSGVPSPDVSDSSESSARFNL